MPTPPQRLRQRPRAGPQQRATAAATATVTRSRSLGGPPVVGSSDALADISACAAHSGSGCRATSDEQVVRLRTGEGRSGGAEGRARGFLVCVRPLNTPFISCSNRSLEEGAAVWVHMGCCRYT